MPETGDLEKEERLKAFFEKARKGVLKHVAENGGSMPMSDMHEYSLKTYFIQHQRFSKMMETFVGESLIDYDHSTQMATLTGKGKEFIQ